MKAGRLEALLPENEPERLAALHEHGILDTPPSEEFDDIVCLASLICGVPIAAVSLLDTHRQWFKAVTGLSTLETPRSAAFCAHTILQSVPLIVPDAEADPRFVDNPLVTGDPNIRFYAGAPLLTDDGHALGSLCVIDRVPRALTSEQEMMLGMLARQVSSQIKAVRLVTERERLVAEREKLEEEARQSSTLLLQLEGAVRSAVEGITISDARLPDRPIIYANPAFVSLTGYSLPEVIGHNCRFLQGEETDPDARHQIREALAEGRSCRVILRNYRKDGSAFWNELTIAPILDASGGVTHFVGIQHDITALKEKEARLIEAQRISRIGDWTLDLAAQKFTWSEEVFRLMEFDPAAGEPVYEAVETRYAAEDRDKQDLLLTRSLETGISYQCDLRLVLPSRTPRWCHLFGQPERDSEGRIVRMVGTVMDITERVQQEQEVKEANLILQVQKAQLEAANVELQALATTDPLTGLLNHRAFQMRLAEEAARVQRQGAAFAVVMLDLDNFKFFNDVYGHSIGDTVLRQVAERLREVCRPYDTLARFGGDEFALILPNLGSSTEDEITSRLRADLAGLTCRLAGEELIPINLSLGIALCTDTSADFHETLRMADERLLRSKTGGAVEADRVRAEAVRSLEGFSMLDALVSAVDNKDRYTRRHSEDVMEYSLLIAREMKMDASTLRMIGVAALLHDVGKIGVPDSVLRKPGRLTDSEYETVQRHPLMGAIMVGAVPGMEDILDAVRHHHERWDGDGYPFGLRERETPLMARLMAVADAFSAMTTDRPYRKGMERAAALQLLEAGAGTQWDPECVAAFVRAFSGIKTGSGCERSAPETTRLP